MSFCWKSYLPEFLSYN